MTSSDLDAREERPPAHDVDAREERLPVQTETPPGMRAEQHSWVLQTTIELQRSVGELTGTVKGLTGTIDELNATVKAQAAEIGDCRRDIVKILAVARFARWGVGIFIALVGALTALIGIMMYRLPAIIETFRAGS